MLKKDKGTDYVLSWKSKRALNSKTESLCSLSIKLSENRITIKFDKDPLAVEQNNCLAKFVNLYIVYDLDDWLKILFRNFTKKIA